jgi:uncharacterized damage-inducible protein DinB
VKKDEYFQFAMEAFKPAEAMLKMIPADKLDWKPGPNFMTLGHLIHHLSSGIGTELRMVIDNSWPSPEEMAEAMKQTPSCGIEEGLARLEQDKTTLQDLLAGMSEEEFANKTVSVPWGWQSNMEKMALNFRDHFVHHKMQLFTYLKLLGLPVNTETLYMG